MSVAYVLADDAAQAGRSYEKKHDGYFQYANNPKHGEYEFGFKRGNPHHYISRYEQGKDWNFKTKVKWADAYDGYGEQYYEYNHGHAKGYHDDHDKGYGHEKGYHSEPAAAYAKAPAKLWYHSPELASFEDPIF